MVRLSASHVIAFATALVAQGWISSAAHAMSFRVVAGGGYESLQPEKDEDADETAKPYTGYALQALGEVGFLDTVPGFSLLAGGGLRYSSLKVKEDDLEYTFSPLMAAAEVGAEFSVIPLLRLQGLVGYDFGLGGKAKAKGEIAGFDIDESYDIDSLGRFQVSARALVTAAPFLSLGLEPAYFTGSFKVDTDDEEATDSVKFTGFAIKAVAAITL